MLASGSTCKLRLLNTKQIIKFERQGLLANERSSGERLIDIRQIRNVDAWNTI